MSRFTLDTAPTYELSELGENITQESAILDRTQRVLAYSDLNTGYRLDGSGLILFNKSAINNQIGNVLATPIGSDHFEPTFGSFLPFRIHEPIDAISATLIYQDTITALETWMRSRITIKKSLAFVRPLDTEDGYVVNLPYEYGLERQTDKFSSIFLR